MKVISLELKSSGSQVTQWQNFLRGLGYSLEVTGIFDERTDYVTRKFQTSNKIAVDGVVGEDTYRVAVVSGMSLVTNQSVVSAYAGERSKPTPLVSNSARMKYWGTFRFVSRPTKSDPESIEIVDDWEDRNIVRFTLPQLVNLGISEKGTVRCHRLLKDPLLELWQAWEDAGVLSDVLTWEGAFCPRYVRGSRSVLSNHAWGSAFDINYEWNRLGHTPAADGAEGSVRRLVPLANKLLWVWGGDFTRRDGMHFEASEELAKKLVPR